MSERHRGCPCGCGELADECAGPSPSPLGSLRTSEPWGAAPTIVTSTRSTLAVTMREDGPLPFAAWVNMPGGGLAALDDLARRHRHALVPEPRVQWLVEAWQPVHLLPYAEPQVLRSERHPIGRLDTYMGVRGLEQAVKDDVHRERGVLDAWPENDEPVRLRWTLRMNADAYSIPDQVRSLEDVVAFTRQVQALAPGRLEMIRYALRTPTPLEW